MLYLARVILLLELGFYLYNHRVGDFVITDDGRLKAINATASSCLEA